MKESAFLNDVANGPMSAFQIRAVALCVLMNMLDGFDVLALAFVGPHLSADWHLSGKELGYLLSAGLFGMGAGSILVAPAADKYGRRTLILFCLPTIALGMLLSAYAQNPAQLVALRAITGLGIGGILASMNVITSEYATNKWRSTAISLQVAGYPIGATLGGLLASEVLKHFGWRGVFVLGGAATAILIPLVMKGLPESIDFLVTKRPRNALMKLNKVLERMKREALTQLPMVETVEVSKSPWVTIVSDGYLWRTLALCMTWLLVMFSIYFVLSWTPKLIVAGGASPHDGLRAGILLNVGGIFGGALFGLIAIKLGTRLLVSVYFVVTALLFAYLGMQLSALGTGTVLFIVAGAGAFGCMTGMYALTPTVYPADCRGTAMGLAIGIGRVGAVIAPIAAGALVDKAWSPSEIYGLFAIPLLIAVLAVIGTGKRKSAAAVPVGIVVKPE
ncbi:MFS transporter [Caballeronia novacaledonica]|uniref:MFS transporter n=1 Tax=Caballeronia novacaledonica TaxID=1544861 RepID=A0AA37IHS5_9BURK|nr:MFS transporter [Caballeronia novacaledonica]GJH27011.1 MFS transporter [Caballeronia novacaledonica]